jgi:hypothetical protein
MADRWQTKLTRPIVMRDGTKLETLAEPAPSSLRCPLTRRRGSRPVPIIQDRNG